MLWSLRSADQTRRHFFSRCGVGLGSMALALGFWASEDSAVAADDTVRLASGANPLAVRPGHFPARAKSVIYLFMAGGPSQLELFDYKPELQRYTDQPIPDSFIKGRRFAFMDIFTKEHPEAPGHDAAGSPPRPARAPGCRSACRTWPGWSTT